MSGDDLTRLLNAERAVRAPVGHLERGLSRLLNDVARRVAPLPIATGALNLGWSLVSKWLVVGFVAGLGGAGAVAQMGAPDAVAAPSAPVPVLPANATSPVASEAAADVPGPPTPPAMPDSPAATRAAPTTTSPLVEPAADVTTFDDELRLITAAKKELERRQPHLAKAWLAEHARRFPSGVFAVERDALEALASCAVHRDPALARAFANLHPRSPLLDRLRRACGTEVPAGAQGTARDFPQIDK
jgi:hypothetical protein